jgi:hypothetical protein
MATRQASADWVPSRDAASSLLPVAFEVIFEASPRSPGPRRVNNRQLISRLEKGGSLNVVFQRGVCSL